MPVLKKLLLGAVTVVATSAIIVMSSATASASTYWIECWTFPGTNGPVAGACVEWNDGVVTFYEFDWNGNWWTY